MYWRKDRNDAAGGYYWVGNARCCKSAQSDECLDRVWMLSRLSAPNRDRLACGYPK